ncbi:hypothetical protein [Paracoccus tibetensis]|uniref:Uncharacterized protein n=1 Tax=Paracoccus tibetensis TaxID=336292 RepID=A0A1G5HDL7_9RHOB|nr:hypothetical protein [Paracoccus tibetensis]SCY61962.1 hypothetical protein SAMN05660710_02127 [Paracoccus tibetensis]
MNPQLTCDSLSVEAIEVLDSTGACRVVSIALGEIVRADGPVTIRAMADLEPAEARELAYDLIDAADKAESTDELRQVRNLSSVS